MVLPLRVCPVRDVSAGGRKVELRGKGKVETRTGARSGMKRSPRTSTNLEDIVVFVQAH